MKREALAIGNTHEPREPREEPREEREVRDIVVELGHDHPAFVLSSDGDGDVYVPWLTSSIGVSFREGAWRARASQAHSDDDGASDDGEESEESEEESEESWDDDEGDDEGDDEHGDERVGVDETQEPARLSHGREREVDGARLRLVTFDAAPLDDVIELDAGWVLYGRRRPLTLGTWPALRVRDGDEGVVVDRALAVVHAVRVPEEEPLDAPLDVVSITRRAPFDESRTQRFAIEMFAACDGITVRDLMRAIAAGSLEPALAQRLFAPVASRAQRVGTLVDDVVLTFDGDVRFVERPRYADLSEDIIERALGRFLRYGDASTRELSRDELADIVRGVAVDAWRDERELREQLATLDVDGARAFFAERAAATAKRDHS